MMKSNSLCLNGQWTLSITQNKKFVQDDFIPNRARAIESKNYEKIPAEVPGNFELDLERAGKIPDPFYGENILLLQDYETAHLFFYRTFNYDGALENPYFFFEGIDTFADIYLNGEKIGSCENMLIPHSFECPGLIRGENELVVHIRPTLLESRKYPVPAGARALPYNYESLWVRKAPHMFGWDIMPRAVSGGLWRGVSLCERPAEYIDELYIYSQSVDREARTADVMINYSLSVEGDNLREYLIRVEGNCGDSHFVTENKIWHTSGSFSFTVENARLWFPKNYGEPNLYDVTVTLLRQGNPVAVEKRRVGLRTVNLCRTSTTDDEGNGEFCFIVNGQKIFVLGTNWAGADVFHSRDTKRLPEILPMLNDLNCNMIRCWGGNVYEHESFYDFCDENGILVWQDFTMACAVMPQERAFYDLIEPEIESVIKRLRGHCSIALWAGDNECDEAYFWGNRINPDPNQNYITRTLIPRIIMNHDPARPYLPSSPYMDEEAFRTGKPISEQHLWGPRDYFKSNYYQTSPCHFASETGYHGCNSPESLKRFLTPEGLWPYEENVEWRIHGSSPEREKRIYAYRISLMANQIKALFGAVPDNLEDFSKASQISQAEAKKFFIERFRISKWRRTGILWWNLIDAWPQISDAVVDYYGEKKLAYHYIKRSQQPLCMIFGEPREQKIELFAVSELQKERQVKFRVTNITENRPVMTGEINVPPNSAVGVDMLPVSNNEQCFYLIEWESGEIKGKNHYMTGLREINYEAYLKDARACGFEV